MRKWARRPGFLVLELADDGLDPSDTGGGAFLLLDLEALELSGVGHVRASAEFRADVADGVHLDDAAVLVVEDSDGTGGLGLVYGCRLLCDGRQGAAQCGRPLAA